MEFILVAFDMGKVSYGRDTADNYLLRDIGPCSVDDEAGGY